MTRVIDRQRRMDKNLFFLIYWLFYRQGEDCQVNVTSTSTLLAAIDSAGQAEEKPSKKPQEKVKRREDQVEEKEIKRERERERLRKRIRIVQQRFICYGFVPTDDRLVRHGPDYRTSDSNGSGRHW